MVGEVLDTYVGTFEKRIVLEPKWPTKSVSAAFAELISKERSGPYRIARSVQTSLNNLIHSIAIRYTPSLAHVKGIGENSLVFERARLFPIHSLEWALSTLEVALHHENELSWVGEVMNARTIKSMKQRYGNKITQSIVDVIDGARKYKRLDWNMSMIEVISYMFDRPESIDEGTLVLEELISSNAKKAWGTRDLLELSLVANKVFAEEDLTRKSRIGVYFFSIISHVNAKSKVDTGPTVADYEQ